MNQNYEERTGNRCFLCGGVCGWYVDYSFEDYGLDGDGLIHVWRCGKCDADYKIYQRFDNAEEK